MKFRQALTLYFLLYIALYSVAFAQPVHIPDHALRTQIEIALKLAPGTRITRTDMSHLDALDLRSQGITSLNGLEFATELTFLVIADNPTIDLTPVSELTQLQKLYIWSVPHLDITPLARLTNLHALSLTACGIADITPLTSLTELIDLDLRYNSIRDINSISNLRQLQTLDLSSNQITDVSSLAQLTNLTFLAIQNNQILDHAPTNALSLSHFTYDQACETPPTPLMPRLENRQYPSVFAPSWLIHPTYTGHDLFYGGSYNGLRMQQRKHGWALVGDLPYAKQLHADIITTTPSMVFLINIAMREEEIKNLGEDWPYWVRNNQGQILRGYRDDYGLVNFTHPHVQDRIVDQVIAVSKCGLFDGIVFDWWRDANDPILPDYLVGAAAEFDARLNILQRIRAQTRPDFLIQVNSNWRKLPRTGPYINGLSMETGIPNWFLNGHTERDHTLNETENTLQWAEHNLRTPRINGVAGEAILNEPADSPENRRWMRFITTLSLTLSDGYVIYQRARNDWWDFWDADLGQPVSAKGQLYQETDGLYIREFTNGWAVYNRSGAAQAITLPEEVQGVASRLTGTEHALSNLDGEMYLKKTATMDSPDINGSDIYITDPIHAVPGAALLLDASNNLGSTVHWVNLGTAGGRLPVSDRFPTVEEGAIEIPASGFSSRRRYYTATASGQTFGGPVHFNPQLYLGDWTLEFLCKRNGDLFSLEHQFAGFQNSPREGLQGVRLGLPNDGQELGMSIHADGFKQPTRALNIFLEENVWTWVTIVSLNGESIIAYQDGVEASRHPGVHFDASVPLDDISIGANSYAERRRNFNGSFAIVRVYDRALSPEEMLQNIGATVIPIANPADVNGDGVVNILDLVVVAQAISTGVGEGDVNGDGVVNVFDLVFVAGAIGGGGAAPSASSLDPSIISAADVERWLALAQGISVGDANFQRGIRFLEGLLAALTPKETTLLPNYPNPFNPETWIPYRLARGAEVAITIYDTKGTLVRRLALGNQEAGYYAERGKAAYWDGRNEDGQAVASGIYIYQFRAGDYAASRRMAIVK